MADIVERLRKFVAGDALLAEEAIAEAADEIERLRKENGRLCAEAIRDNSEMRIARVEIQELRDQATRLRKYIGQLRDQVDHVEPK